MASPLSSRYGTVQVVDGAALVLPAGDWSPFVPTIKDGRPVGRAYAIRADGLEAYSASSVVASDPSGFADCVVPVISLFLSASMGAWCRR